MAQSYVTVSASRLSHGKQSVARTWCLWSLSYWFSVFRGALPRHAKASARPIGHFGFLGVGQAAAGAGHAAIARIAHAREERQVHVRVVEGWGLGVQPIGAAFTLRRAPCWCCSAVKRARSS